MEHGELEEGIGAVWVVIDGAVVVLQSTTSDVEKDSVWTRGVS